MGAPDEGRNLLRDPVGLGKLADCFLSDWILFQPTRNCLFLFCGLGLAETAPKGKALRFNCLKDTDMW